ncbi:MAG: hypothetical protein IH800_15905 [Myxococcales bacterium]|nr:hypothetical protein [Myxococcales bacterium]
MTAASAQEFRSVPPEPAVRGVSVTEHFVRQQQLNTWLTREMPHGTLATRVGIKLTRDERSDLQKRVPAGGAPLRIGTVKSLTPAVSVSGLVPQAQNQGVSQVAGGRFQTTDDGGFVWALAIGSEGANGIRVHLKNFSLPANADMYFFNLEGEAHGPYQGRGRNGDGDFWTNTVFSETAVILLRQFGPATQQDQRNLAFVIDRVGHIGGGFLDSGPQNHWGHNQCGNATCVLDANCTTTDPAADDARKAVAKIEWIQGRFIFTCSGGLIADTDGSTQRNLFLTANHCISKKRNASNMETFFSYTTSGDLVGVMGSAREARGRLPSAPRSSGRARMATSRCWSSVRTPRPARRSSDSTARLSRSVAALIFTGLVTPTSVPRCFPIIRST